MAIPRTYRTISGFGSGRLDPRLVPSDRLRDVSFYLCATMNNLGNGNSVVPSGPCS